MLEDNRVLLKMYETMLRIREFEERVGQLFMQALIRGTTHLSIGEEAVSVGTCFGIRPTDYILTTHRGHGDGIAKGSGPKRILAEVAGKKAGYCKGKGGTMHITDLSVGNLGANGIVGGGIPIAVGVGLAIQYQKRDNVVVGFFGDGAVNEGAFHESLNLAAIWKLPVLFVCKNNLYGMSVPIKEACLLEDLCERASAYGMPGVKVDGMDPTAVRDVVAKAAERARAGEGPTLIECKTYRYFGHSKSDPRAYRTKDEEAAWRARDPIAAAEKALLEAGSLDQEGVERIRAKVKAEMDEAAEFALSSPEPELAELTEDVYV